MSLHDDITARLDELEALAKAADADTPGPWGYLAASMDLVDRTLFEIAVECEDAAGRLIPAVASPDVVLRAVAEDRRLLTRHRPLTYELTDDQVATTCNWCDGGTDRVPEWPCPDLESLARRLGIEAP